MDKRKPIKRIVKFNIGKLLNKVRQFKDLGTMVTEHNEIVSEDPARIQTGNKC